MIEKNDLLRMLDNADKQKIMLEQAIGKLNNEVNILRERYVKVLGKIELLSEQLSLISQNEEEQAQQKEKIEEKEIKTEEVKE